MSPEEKNMNSDEFNKAREAIRLVIEAIRTLSERPPGETGTPPMKLTKAWGLLDEACGQLGLPTRGRPT
jgi:hypothetical protein